MKKNINYLITIYFFLFCFINAMGQSKEDGSIVKNDPRNDKVIIIDQSKINNQEYPEFFDEYNSAEADKTNTNSQFREFHKNEIDSVKKGQILPEIVEPIHMVFDGELNDVQFNPQNIKGENNIIPDTENHLDTKPPLKILGWQSIMTEDFEGAFPSTGWDVHAQNGYTDAYWDDIGDRSHAGSESAWCAAAGTQSSTPASNYKSNMKAWMIYGPFDLSDATDATLDFYYWNQSEISYDYFMWMASTNGTSFYGSATSGTTSGWVSRSFDLTSVYTIGDLTGQSQVWITFLFQTDASLNYEGAYVDDIVLQKEVTDAGDPDIRVDPTSLTINQSQPALLSIIGENNTYPSLQDNVKYIPKIDSKYIINTFYDDDRNEIDMIKIPGYPPEFFRAAVATPTLSSVILSNVPAYDWSFGCAATAAAMIAGYYDNIAYTNMYAGPTNGGVAPMDNSTWGSALIGGETRSMCPISATRDGLDGRSGRGHTDDYWIHYGNTDPDPYIQNGWTEHTQGDCTGDYMGTNQSDVGNSDGSTTLFNYTDGRPLEDYTGQEPGARDACHGFRLFYESRGYTVVQNYNQFIMGYDGNILGFTFDQFKQEIDAGRPVLIHVTGHTMVGYGYDDPGTVYIHDTWDYNDHTMTWGGSYNQLQHFGVSVVELEPMAGSDIFTIHNDGPGVLSVTSLTDDKSWLTTSGFPSTPFDINSGSSQVVTCNVDWGQLSSQETATVTIASNDPDENPVTVSVTAIPDVAPTTYTVTTSSNPAEGGSTTGDGTYNEGSEVTVTATTNTGWQFVDWTENGSQVSSALSYVFTIQSIRVLVANFSQASCIDVSLPDLSSAPGSSIEIPVTVGDLTGENVISYQFDVLFDNAVLNATGINETGTLSDASGWSVFPNTGTAGVFTIGAFGANALSGAGTLINLVFNVVGSDGDGTDLTFSNFMFNSGSPCANTSNGHLDVSTDLFCGDASCDQLVNAYDAALTLQFAIGLITSFPDVQGEANADVDMDGTVTAFDAANTLRFSIGLDPVGETCFDTPALAKLENIDIETLDLTMQLNERKIGEVGIENYILLDGFESEENVFSMEFNVELDIPNTKLEFIDLPSGYIKSVNTIDDNKYIAAIINPYGISADDIKLKITSPENNIINKITLTEIKLNNQKLGERILANLCDELLIKEYELTGAYPNPFNPSTNIVFAVPQKSLVKIEVFDILGRKVQTLLNEEVVIGQMQIIWNGKNSNGEQVSTGNYIITMRSNNFFKAIKVNFIK